MSQLASKPTELNSSSLTSRTASLLEAKISKQVYRETCRIKSPPVRSLKAGSKPCIKNTAMMIPVRTGLSRYIIKKNLYTEGKALRASWSVSQSIEYRSYFE